ncbi:MAG: DUF4124 domain-containing protein [Burkholderiales bacterium]|jgi:hypothetical protein|nr:DUF4124 domain-containing protein [Burkholderiales bacterium]
MRAATFVLLIFFSITASATIYKCPTASGKVEYSSKPCADGETVNIRPSATIMSQETMRDQPGGGQIHVGMTPSQVRSIWGAPRAVNATTDKSGLSEQWVYDRNGRTHYVYIRDDKVSSMSSHEEIGSGSRSTEPPSTAPAYKPTPTRREIEEQEREDKSGNRRFISQGMTQTRVRSDIGEPENKSYRTGIECWNYLPAHNDRQAHTSICFDGHGKVLTVDRTIER